MRITHVAVVRAVTCLCLGGVGACAPSASPTAPRTDETSGATAINVLMVTATAGFRHDSIPAAQQAMNALAASARDISVTQTEDLATLTRTRLTDYDVLCFALTSGELAINAEQKAAVLDFVRGGKGFIGVHSAADSFYQWPEYRDLVGAYFKEHPWTQQASVIVEDRSHAITRELAERFSLLEEFYTFQDDPRPRVHVLLRLDADSVGATGDYPLAWVRDYGNGRAYYNALGHFDSTWRDPWFQQQIAAAIRWTSRR